MKFVEAPQDQVIADTTEQLDMQRAKKRMARIVGNQAQAYVDVYAPNRARMDDVPARECEHDGD